MVCVGVLQGYVWHADNMWQRFVTLFHEDQDLLRKAAHEKGYRGLFCTNYTGSTTSPLQFPDGTADQYRM